MKFTVFASQFRRVGGDVSLQLDFLMKLIAFILNCIKFVRFVRFN